MERAANIITKSFSSRESQNNRYPSESPICETLTADSVASAMIGWDDNVMFDAYVDHLSNEPDIWHGYLAKRDGEIIGVAVVVPPGKTTSSV